MALQLLCTVSDNEKRYILDGVSGDLRADGRSRSDLRCAAAAKNEGAIVQREGLCVCCV